MSLGTAKAVSRAVPRPTGGDIQSSGSGYGNAQANAFKQTPAYRQAVVDTFLHQSAPQQHAILQGAFRMPTLEGQTIIKYLQSATQAKIPGDLGIKVSVNPQGIKLQPGKSGAAQIEGVLTGAGHDLSGLINQIPNNAPNTPGNAIAERAGLGPGAIGKNLLKDAVNLPAEVGPSIAIPVGDALKGDWKGAYDSTIGSYVNALKHPVQSIGQHPLDTYLMFSGVAHPLERGIEAVGRAATRTPLDLTQPSVALTGNLTHERPPLSTTPHIRVSQKEIGKQFYEPNDQGVLVPRSENIRARQVKIETSRLVGQNERVRRAGHSEQVTAHAQSVLKPLAARATHAVKTTLQYDPKAPLIPGADVLSLIAQGIIRRPDTVVADLEKHLAQVSATRPDLLDFPGRLAEHDQYVKDLQAALADKKFLANPKPAFDAAARYAKEYPQVEKQAAALGHFRDMGPDALERRTLMAATLTHMPGARYDLEHGMVRDEPNPEMARLEARQQSAMALSRGATTAGERASAARAILALQDHIHQTAETIPRQLSTAEMRAFVKTQTGGRDVAFVSHEPRRGDSAHYVSGQRRPYPAAMGNTLYAFSHGLTNPSHEAMLEQRVRMRGIVDAHKAMNRLDQQLVTHPADGPWKTYQDAARDTRGTGLVPIRLAQQFHPSASLQQALKGVDMGSLEEEAARRSLNINARLSPSNEKGAYGAIDRHAASQLLAHESLISPNVFLRGFRGANNQFRQVALATSFKHLPGVAQEVLIRSAASGVGPISWFAGRDVLKRMGDFNPDLARERRIQLTGGTVTGQALAIQTRQVAGHFEGTLLHGPLSAWEKAVRAPGLRQASTLWRSWARFTLGGTKRMLEEQAQIAGLGKAVIQEFGGSHGLVAKALGTWGQMIDQAAKGIEDEATMRRMGATVRRIYGRWTDLTPGEQTALMFSPFGMWWTNSVQFLARLPVDHPVLTSALAATNAGTEAQRQKLGLDLMAPGALPLYQQGAIPTGSALWSANYYSPAGIANDPLETAGSLIEPWLGTALLGAAGVNWHGGPITSPGNPKGYTTSNVGQRATVILNSLAASFIPLYTKAQTLVQGGASSYDTSTLLNPETKGPNPGLLKGLVKDVMPVRLGSAPASALASGKIGTLGYDFSNAGTSGAVGGQGRYDFSQAGGSSPGGRYDFSKAGGASSGAGQYDFSRAGG